MLFHIFIVLLILTGIVSLTTFILYVHARMNEQEEKEKQYRSIHYLSLFIFVFFGVIALILLSNMEV